MGTGQRAAGVGPESEAGPEERIAVRANAGNHRRKSGRKGDDDGIGRCTDDEDCIARGIRHIGECAIRSDDYAGGLSANGDGGNHRVGRQRVAM